MSKNPLDFLKQQTEKLNKDRNNSLKVIAIIIMGCFFYLSYFNKELIIEAKAQESKKISSKSDIFENDWKYQYVDDFELRGQSFNKKEVVLRNDRDILRENLEKEIKSMTIDHPIEEMAPFISEFDNKVAALIVGIAKKESNWGLRAPSKNGQTCYNYWGYKGSGSRGTSLGYGCFGTAQEAVTAIGNRIEELASQSIDTPAEMVVWKCGRSCTGHDPAGVKKWISDVSIYYSKITRVAS